MIDAIITSLTERYPGIKQRDFRDETRIEVSSDLYQVLSKLKEAGFDLLVDITCVDYLQFRSAGDHEPAGRFSVVYLLSNTIDAQRITVRAYVDDHEPTVDSVVPLWEGANWLEREVWDMFGIHFDGHPDLRRILLPEEFSAHPLRKDYPLQGRGERHNFPIITRSQA